MRDSFVRGNGRIPFIGQAPLIKAELTARSATLVGRENTSAHNAAGFEHREDLTINTFETRRMARRFDRIDYSGSWSASGDGARRMLTAPMCEADAHPRRSSPLQIAP